MDDKLRKHMIQEQIRIAAEVRKTITAKYSARHPDFAERKYLRLVNAYMTIEREILIRYIPELYLKELPQFSK